MIENNFNKLAFGFMFFNLILNTKTYFMKKNTKTFVIYFLISLPLFTNAQQKLDTIFYDRYWQVTSIKDSVQFYRIATKMENSYKVEDYYVSNKIQMIGYFSSLDDNIKHGDFKYYFENGNLSIEGKFEKNKKEGVWKYYYQEGKIWYQTFYSNDMKNGELNSYYRSGELRRKAKFKKNNLKNEKCFDSKINNADYNPVIEEPMFVGGENAMMKFISENVVYPKQAHKNKIEGKVLVRFLITKRGEIDSIQFLSKPQPLFDEEVLYVLALMPKWIPGKSDCEKKGEYFTLPFNFKLND